MCTYVFHWNTAPIHQGSCIALGDFLVKEEPHYAVEEVLSKNTCRALLLSDSPLDSWEGLRRAAAAAQGTRLSLPSPQTRQWRCSWWGSTSPMTWESVRGTHDICQNPRGCWQWPPISIHRGGQGRIGGVLYPEDLVSFGLDWSMGL